MFIGDHIVRMTEQFGAVPKYMKGGSVLDCTNSIYLLLALGGFMKKAPYLHFRALLTCIVLCHSSFFQ